MKLTGNIVTPRQSDSAALIGRDPASAESIKAGAVRAEESWILPGFIEMYLHGMGPCTVEGGAEHIRSMAAFLATKGVTHFLPTYASAPYEVLALRTPRKIKMVLTKSA